MRRTEKTVTLSFRLPVSVRAKLARQAAKEKLSAGELARRLVIDAMADKAIHQIAQETSTIRQKVEELERKLARATEAILVDGGRTRRRDAEVWVRKNMR